jgi:putative glycosyltransferase
MDLSIVATMYYSAPYLEEFYTRVSAVAGSLVESYEIVLVNDGSPDNSLQVAIGQMERDARVRVVDLSRNFGHHKAIMTGLMHAHGERVFLLDCDLEEEPELLTEFDQVMREQGSDVVYGVQSTRKGKFIERAGGDFYYWLFNFLSTDRIPKNLVTARLMTRRYVEALLEHREREVVLAGIWAITGFSQIPVTIIKKSRSQTTYTLRRRAALLVQAITSFSNKPLVFIFYIGCLIVGLASLGGLYLILRRIFFGIYFTGWPSLIVSVWLLGGLTIFSVGLIGIYLSKVFTEVKQRPYTIVREVYERH